MLELLLPRQLDNAFRGWRLGLWLFVPVLIVRFGIAAKSAFWARDTAIVADGFPLDQLSPAGADIAVQLFALMGLAGLVLALLGVVALLRYRAMIPLMYLAFILNQLGNKVLNAYHPTISGGAKMVGAGLPLGFVVINGLLAVMVLGFVLSLIPRTATSSGRI